MSTVLGQRVLTYEPLGVYAKLAKTIHPVGLPSWHGVDMAKKSARSARSAVVSEHRVPETAADFTCARRVFDEVLGDYGAHQYFIDVTGDTIPDLEGKTVRINGIERRVDSVGMSDDGQLILTVYREK